MQRKLQNTARVRCRLLRSRGFTFAVDLVTPGGRYSGSAGPCGVVDQWVDSACCGRVAPRPFKTSSRHAEGRPSSSLAGGRDSSGRATRGGQPCLRRARRDGGHSRWATGTARDVASRRDLSASSVPSRVRRILRRPRPRGTDCKNRGAKTAYERSCPVCPRVADAVFALTVMRVPLADRSPRDRTARRDRQTTLNRRFNGPRPPESRETCPQAL